MSFVGDFLENVFDVADRIMESPTAPLTLFAMGSGFFPGDAAFAAGADPSALASIAAEESALAAAPHAFGAGEAFASGALTPAALPLMPPADLSGVQLAQIAQSSDPIEAIIKLSDVGGGSALAGATRLDLTQLSRLLLQPTLDGLMLQALRLSHLQCHQPSFQGSDPQPNLQP